MSIYIFGKTPEDNKDKQSIQLLFENLCLAYEEIFVWEPLFNSIKSLLPSSPKIRTFAHKSDLKDSNNILLSLGGDGTMLDTINFVIGTQIAVLGVNLGHLGFLTTAGREDISHLVSEIKKNNFTIEKRPILEVDYPSNEEKRRFAVNEACFISTNRGSVINLEVFVDDKYLSTYSADGIILATPTGSTAYSMAAGGPIISPQSQCLCLTPIAPHNLTFRPIIISDNSMVKVRIPKNNNDCEMLLDGYSIFKENNMEVVMKKSPYFWNLVRLENQDFFKAIRDKLMWGTTPKYLKTPQ
ncbi:MAG: NAD(+)/NADH kinase [Bacteroidota bacterium]|nr:NAD(+)/NADH kinase [Bacteroidota bacterium]